tara:strand:+ start:426 stop:845 length:420 start_codon:yes stop_codon:yes gene_type:complete
MPKKKFSETKLGKFLDRVGSSIVGQAENILPDNGFYGIIKNLIAKEHKLSPKDREFALELLETDLIEMQEVSKRWQSDMKSDSWLSKNVRPLTLVFFSISYVAGWFLEYPLDNITGLLSLIVGAYFGSRGFEKIKALSK